MKKRYLSKDIETSSRYFNYSHTQTAVLYVLAGLDTDDKRNAIYEGNSVIGNIDSRAWRRQYTTDLDLLVDVVDGLRAVYDKLENQFNEAQTTITGLREGRATYESMVAVRNVRIKDLERQLGVNPQTTKSKSKT